MRVAQELTERDVITLRAIRSLRGSHDRGTRQGEADYRSRLRELEAALSDAGREVYLTWPSDKVTVELGRWKAAYRLVRTRRGYSAFRWIARRKEYARRAVATCMDDPAVAAYRGLLRV